MLPDHIQLELVTPDRLVIRESVVEVQVPGLVGYLGVLPGHTPLLAELGIGQLSYRQGSQTFYATVIGGLVGSAARTRNRPGGSGRARGRH